LLCVTNGRPEVGLGNTNRALVERNRQVRSRLPLAMSAILSLAAEKQCTNKNTPQAAKPRGSFDRVSDKPGTNPYGRRPSSAKSNNRSRFKLAISKSLVPDG
jgi:hypothetical protein